MLTCLQIGEFVSDYVEVRRDYRDWTPAYERPMVTKGEISTSESGSNTPSAGGDRHGQPDVVMNSLTNGNGVTHANGNGVPHTNGAPGLDSISEKPAEELS